MRFIVVDGLDGSGKDTQSKLLYDKSSYHITRKYVLANCVLDEYKKVGNIV